MKNTSKEIINKYHNRLDEINTLMKEEKLIEAYKQINNLTEILTSDKRLSSTEALDIEKKGTKLFTKLLKQMAYALNEQKNN